MSSPSQSNPQRRSSLRPHSSYSDTAFEDLNPVGGIPIHCQYCPAQDFRRSRLRFEDFKFIFMMRYPVRCLRCSQRQFVSFVIAAISIPSHIKQRRARRTLNQHKHWSEPGKPSTEATTPSHQESTAAADSNPSPPPPHQ